ncbi:sodium-coupled monocarboxylate transporter 1-like [Sarcoptes scabiei]|nr:sodium-coupled monocarboxylate transporter 1-like [Sarcoptes scabiei]
MIVFIGLCDGGGVIDSGHRSPSSSSTPLSPAAKGKSSVSDSYGPSTDQSNVASGFSSNDGQSIVSGGSGFESNDGQSIISGGSEFSSNDGQTIVSGGSLGGDSGSSSGGSSSIPGGKVSAAIKTKHTFEMKEVDIPFEEQEPQIIEIDGGALPLEIHFRSASSRIRVKQTHSSGGIDQVERTQSEEEPTRLIHEVRKPIIQEVREIITPFRKVIQEIEPVQEEIHTVVSKGQGRRGSSSGSTAGSFGGGSFGSGKGSAGASQGSSGFGSGQINISNAPIGPAQDDHSQGYDSIGQIETSGVQVDISDDFPRKSSRQRNRVGERKNRFRGDLRGSSDRSGGSSTRTYGSSSSDGFGGSSSHNFGGSSTDGFGGSSSGGYGGSSSDGLGGSSSGGYGGSSTDGFGASSSRGFDRSSTDGFGGGY